MRDEREADPPTSDGGRKGSSAEAIVVHTAPRRPPEVRTCAKWIRAPASTPHLSLSDSFSPPLLALRPLLPGIRVCAAVANGKERAAFQARHPSPFPPPSRTIRTLLIGSINQGPSLLSKRSSLLERRRGNHNSSGALSAGGASGVAACAMWSGSRTRSSILAGRRRLNASEH